MNIRCLLWRLRRKSFMLSVLSLVTLCFLLLVSYIPESTPPPVALDGIQTFHKYNINCSAIYNMEPEEVDKSLTIRQRQIVEDKDESLTGLTSNCSLFIKTRGYDKVCVSEEEEDFPLAYSLVVHKSAWQVERLIRALYSPNNIYCIHYDAKSPAHFISAMKGLASCLPNVFIASKLESVFYAGISRLKADLNCLSDLLSSEVKWKYVINLCGQDFPLRSKTELVSELKKLNGANMVESCRPIEMKRKRFAFHHKLMYCPFEYYKLPIRTPWKKTPPPHGVEMFTGSAYFILSREFIVFMNSSEVAKDLLAWSEDTYSPDEHYWATLTRLPGVPGEVSRSHPDITDLISKTRLVKWHYYVSGNIFTPCTGRQIRGVCVYGAAEMNWMLNYGHWFANKFDPKVDPVPIQCLEEMLEEKEASASLTCRKG